jgi:hypothetical protein
METIGIAKLPGLFLRRPHVSTGVGGEPENGSPGSTGTPTDVTTDVWIELRKKARLYTMWG